MIFKVFFERTDYNRQQVIYFYKSYFDILDSVQYKKLVGISLMFVFIMFFYPTRLSMCFNCFK